MSRTIDERVVSMQFDNKQFESNVKTSLGTIDKLKQSLNFKGVSKSLENIDSAAKNVKLSSLGDAAHTVGLRFSAMYTMADQALRNITTRVQQTAERTIKAFTVDPVKTGLQEYETQIGAVQTILANTQSKGTTLDDVNNALDQLNTYADQTIYNFTQMTRNIGTFTAAGVDLDKSVTSIKGIANLAAVSGSTSEQASTAWYQLSQALAAGKVQLMDWNSVVNAGMGGQVFQDALKRTATQMGYNVDAMIEKYGSFRESLTQGEWLTAEVLTETLTQLSGAYSKADLIAQGYSESQAEEIVKLAETAVDAATKVKTFSQLMDTLKESAQSGWSQTWELLVGDFEEAKELWSGVSEEVGGFINAISESRNTLLKGALTSNWDKLIEKINEAGIETTVFEDKLKSTLKEHGYDVEKLIKDHGSLKKAFKSGAVSSDILKEAINGIGESIASVDLSTITDNLKKGMTGDDIKKVQEVLKGLGHDFSKFGIDGVFGSETEAAVKAFQELSGLEVTGIIDDETLAALDKAATKVAEFDGSIDSLIDNVTELGGRELLIQSLANAWNAIKKPLVAVREAWGEVFEAMKPEQLYDLIAGFEKFTKKLIMSDDSAKKVKRTFKGLFAILDVLKTIVGGGVSIAFKVLSKILEHFDLNILDVAAAAGDAMVKFRDWLFENNKLVGAFDAITNAVIKAGTAVKDWITNFINLPAVQNIITNFRTACSDAFGKIGTILKDLWGIFGEFFTNLMSMDGFSLENVKMVFSELVESLRTYFGNLDVTNIFGKIGEVFKNFKDEVAKHLEGSGIKIDEIKEKIISFVETVKKKIGDNMGSILAVGTLLTFLFMIKKIKDAVTLIAKPFSMVEDFLGSLGDTLKDFGKAAKSIAFKNIAISIAILAGSVALLATLDQTKVWSSVGAIGALALGLVAISLVLGKFDTGDFGKLSVSLLGLAGSMLLMAVAAKVIGEVDADGLLKTGIVMAAFLGVVWVISKATKDTNMWVNEFGKMMLKLSIALLLLAVVTKIFGSMDTGTLIKGGVAIAAFLGMTVVMAKVTKSIGKHVDKFGKMMLAISASLILMAVAVKMLGGMELERVLKGGLIIAAFLGMTVVMAKVTQSIGKRADKFGKMMLAISASLILMAVAVKMLGEMDMGTLIRGSLVIAAFAGVMVGLMAATKLLGRHSYNAGKMGALLLSFSASVLLITGAIFALSLLDKDDIAKAMLAISGIGVIFAGLIVATKFSKGIKTGQLIALSIGIAVMAASIAALTFIDKKDLWNATLVLSTIVGMFSLLAIASKFSNVKSLLTIAGMTLVVGGIAGLIIILADKCKDADKALVVAKAISFLIMSLSAGCALLAIASKFGPKSAKGLLVLAGMLGILTLFAGIAIWQLPNIADQFSSFMTKLQPFLRGANDINRSTVTGLKILGEAMLEFTKAGALYAVFDIAGGVTRAFSKFTLFIAGVVPIVKRLALAVSGKNVNINTTNLNAVIGAISGLADAASKVPTTKMGLLVGGGKGIFGLLAGISIPQLTEFTQWVREIIPSMKDLATVTSEIEIDGDAISSICTGVLTLAEAASMTPSATVVLGGGGGNGIGGAFLAIDIPLLTEFKNWIIGASDAMSGFATDIKDSGITSDHATTLKSICEGAVILAEAAKDAPGIDAALGLAKFAGGFGLFGAASIPWLSNFTTWIKGVIPDICDNGLKKIKGSSITESDAKVLKSICEGVKVLGEAAKDAPGIDAALGLAKFVGGIGLFGAVSIPWLDSFTTWITGVIPVMCEKAIEIKQSSITESDTANLISICEGVKALGEAAGAAPGIDVALGFAAFAGGVATGLYFTIPQLESFKNWIGEVGPVMQGFIGSVTASDLTSEDAEIITSICTAVKTLGEAVDVGGGGTKWIAGVAAIGPAVAAFVGVEEKDLDSFREWLNEVGEPLKNLFTTISTITLDTSQASTVTNICTAVKTLADAADSAPKKEEYSGVFGSWVSETQLTEFTTWISGVIDALAAIGEKLHSSYTDVDTQRLLDIAKSAKAIGEAVEAFASGMVLQWFSVDRFSEAAEGIAGVMVDFSTNLNGINVDQVNSGGNAARNICKILTELANFPYESFDSSTFKTKAGEIAEAVKNFHNKLDGISVGSDVDQASSLATMLSDMLTKNYDNFERFTTASSEIGQAMSNFDKQISGIETGTLSEVVDEFVKLAKANFSSLENLDDTLTGVGKSSVEGFMSAFTDVGDELKTIGAGIVTNLVSGMSSESDTITKNGKSMAGSCSDAIRTKYTTLWSAGKYLVEGFAAGISNNDYIAEAKARAMAKAAARAAEKELDEHSPSKVFYKIGDFAGQGFVNALGDYERKSYDASADMAKSAKSGLIRAMSNIGNAIDMGINDQPVIRPILDLSEVESGANSINGMFGMHAPIRAMAHVRAVSSSTAIGQNGFNSDVISAINNLGKKIGNVTGNTYHVNGVTYDDGSNVSDAVKSLIRAARIERRT